MAIDYKVLDSVLSSMNMEKDHRPLQLEPGDERAKVQFELKSGVEISRDDFDNIPTVAGLISHNNEHAFLYIDEPRKSEEELSATPAIDAQRFHLVKTCRTLLQMHNAGRSERYVLIRNSNGKFPSKPIDPVTFRTITDRKIDAQLLPCKNCLTELNYQGYKKPHPGRHAGRPKNEQIWLNFKVEEFFKHYEPFFFTENFYRSTRNADTANYTEDHPKIRDELLEIKNYQCDDCGVPLSERPDLLHLHHKNGQRGDNRRENLEIICVLCYSSKPLHNQMEKLIKAKDAIYIRQKRLKR